MPLDDPPAVDPLLTPKQAAELFQVSAETVSRWAAAGELESIVLPSGHRRFRRSVIERAIQPIGRTQAEPTAAAS